MRFSPSLRSAFSFLALLTSLARAQDDVYKDTVFAETYGRPLIEYYRLAPQLVQGLGTNTFFKRSGLSKPEDKDVVLPNVDTVYGSAIVDLSSSNVNITFPQAEADRYYTLSFFDPFGSNYANVGSSSNASSGTYLLRRASDVHAPSGYDTSCTEGPGYSGYINAPTNHGVVLIRALLKNNNTDLELVQSLMNQTMAFAVPRSDSPGGPANAISMDTFSGLTNDTALNTLTLLSRLMDDNPPWNMSNPTEVMRKLHNAGLSNNTYTQPYGVNITEAYETAQTAALGYGTGPGMQPFNNDWIEIRPQGLYGDNLPSRSVWAQRVYIGLTEDQALYPMYSGEVESKLQPGEALMYSFADGKPPLEQWGFWSATMYDEAGFLIENTLDVYSLGDRSSIKYPDGQEVYGSNTSRDGPFGILVQRADEEPPSNWTSNWLPAPTDDSTFQIVCPLQVRFYGPTDAIRDGTWQFPIVKKVDAMS